MVSANSATKARTVEARAIFVSILLIGVVDVLIEPKVDQPPNLYPRI
jgi:hypothetical protein